jgi:hypothetical protein
MNASWILFFLCILSPISSRAQDYVTGSFEGEVRDSVTGAPIAGATVQFINEDTGVPVAKQTDASGRFRQGLLPPGDYTIIISAPGFTPYRSTQFLRPLRPTIVVPVPINLKPESTSNNDLTRGQTFVSKWAAFDLWEAPSNWQANPGWLLVNERGIGLPRDEAYHGYSDFILVSDVKMLNGVAASFVVHAADKSNYYLIQVTGPNADEPYVLRSFIVKNGVSYHLQSIAIDPYANTIQPGKYFEVSMKMSGDNLQVSVTDSETGTRLLLGTLSDANRNFRVGAVGIAVRDTEQNQIGRFIISLF